MTGCMTFQMPDLEMTKEEEIKNFARILNGIKPLLEKYKKIAKDSATFDDAPRATSEDISNLYYYKYKDLYFYHELLDLLEGDKEKLAEILKNWKPSGGVGGVIFK